MYRRFPEINRKTHCSPITGEDLVPEPPHEVEALEKGTPGGETRQQWPGRRQCHKQFGKGFPIRKLAVQVTT